MSKNKTTYQAPTTVKPIVHIDYRAYSKLLTYIRNVENEVGGIGSVKVTSTGDFLVTDIFLIEQTVSGASTNLSPQGVAKFLVERKRQHPEDDLSGYQLWWHSHYNFNTFWSGIDTGTIAELGENFDWLLSIVGNQNGDLLARVDMLAPFRVSLDELEITHGLMPTEDVEAIKTEIREKVKTYRYIAPAVHTSAPSTSIIPAIEATEDVEDFDLPGDDGPTSNYRIYENSWYRREFHLPTSTIYYVFDMSYNEKFEINDEGLPTTDEFGKVITLVLDTRGIPVSEKLAGEVFHATLPR